MSAVIDRPADRGKPKKRDASGFEKRLAAMTSFGAAKRARLYDRLYRFTSRGYDIRAGLEGAYMRYERTGDARRAVWRDWVRGLQAGERFHNLIAPYVPAGERMLIAAGEESGSRLPDALRNAQYVAESLNKVKSALVGALVYPIMLLLMFVGLLVIVSVKLIPALEGLAPLESWPPVSASLYYTAEAVRNYGLWAGLAMVAGFMGVIYSLPRWQSGLRRSLDHKLPPFTIYREVESATTMITLSAMVAAGQSIDAALRAIRGPASIWLGWHLDRMIKALAGGKPPSVAMETGLVNPETMGDLQDYDRAGAFSEAIAIVGKDIVEDTIMRVEAQSAVLRIVMMFLVAGGMVWTYAAIGMLVLDVSAKAEGAV